MKSDNEPAISLPVYFKSVKKTENMFAKKTKNKNKRTQKERKKKVSIGESRPRAYRRGRYTRYLQRHD